MTCLLFKLRFDAPAHFGSPDGALSLYSSEEHFRADTLFSALCHTALRSLGEDALEHLIGEAQADRLRLSDAMPWRGEELYLPKPCVNSEQAQELPAQLRKAVKKLRWIPVSAFSSFVESVHGGAPYVPEEKNSFGVHVEYTRARITEGADTEPYQVGAFQFNKDCGLWFLCQCGDEEAGRIEKLVELLGYSGIGGKVSSGLGTFHVEDTIYLDEPFDGTTEWLSNAVTAESRSYLLLTSALPAEDELDSVMASASCQLVRRGGFIHSETFAENAMKKQTQYYLAAGTVTAQRFRGGLYDVGFGGAHPVWRFARPVQLGVEL